MQQQRSFREQLRQDFSLFVNRQKQRFPEDETLKIDLHCHDMNSDGPDEPLGRILRLPETWTTTDQVLKTLKDSHVDAVTITNHNNALSCFDLLDRGIDVVVGAEFTCCMPESDTHLHVLTYGFEPAHEERLHKLRGNVYHFLDYANDQDFVTVLAHPLFFPSSSSVPPIDILEKLTLMFDNFEVINGHRDLWENLLMAAWLEMLTEDRIDAISQKTGISPHAFCRHPYSKSLTGGSDCHMGLFVGMTGTLMHVPDLPRRLKGEAHSSLVIEALRDGKIAPYGLHIAEEKLAATFLDHTCQVAMNMEDPGLIRMLLQRGSVNEKLCALVIANVMMELKNNRYTSQFLKMLHQSLHGRRPGFLARRVTLKQFRPMVQELDTVAVERRKGQERFVRQLHKTIPRLFQELNQNLAARIGEKFRGNGQGDDLTPAALMKVIEKFDIPSDLRTLLGSNGNGHGNHVEANLDKWTGGLLFPFLTTLLICGASFASCKVMYSSRNLLRDFSGATGRYQHPKRALWLTDTLFDRNGVATALRLMHQEVKRRDLPIDFAVCSNDAEPDDHLVILRPLTEFTTPFYRDQPFRPFDLMELNGIFIEGGYDRIICSTEALMGIAALYLKHAFEVPAYFYLHTDWIDFALRTLQLEKKHLDWVRRLLRTLYSAYDGIFVLNNEQYDWLSGDSMGMPEASLYRTAHWVDDVFRPQPVSREDLFPGVRSHEAVVLFAGRISEEKGVMELPQIMNQIRRRVKGVRLAVAGTGPAEEKLFRAIPDAIRLGWLDKRQLSRVYSAADVMLLPSHFDTFGCVVLEALSCGLPVVAFNSKGPRDIILHGTSGFLADNHRGMIHYATEVLTDPHLAKGMRLAARERGKSYQAEDIVNRLLMDLRLPGVDQRQLRTAAGADDVSLARAN
jgi:glycosyltransferase involved in cell wall biosynthesis